MEIQCDTCPQFTSLLVFFIQDVQTCMLVPMDTGHGWNSSTTGWDSGDKGNDDWTTLSWGEDDSSQSAARTGGTQARIRKKQS
ncbi:unnamed protein product [Echinostoma caproni]|uniref:MAM domain-containing protein n=1 Tax=Echinostoma caproni TaxID=27848 RepID=A0A183BCQ1_9TREM|nr:unnamed protein product [Echinostoma caproni]